MDELFENQLEENLKTTKTLEHWAKELSRTTSKVLNRLSKKLHFVSRSANVSPRRRADRRNHPVNDTRDTESRTRYSNAPEGNVSKFGKEKLAGRYSYFNYLIILNQTEKKLS